MANLVDHNEHASITAVEMEPALRPDRDTDESAFRAMFVAIRRAPMDEAGFDEATVVRLVEHQFELQRAGHRYTHPLARTEAIVVGDVVVGRLISDDSGEHVVLVDIMVDPAHQGAGIGTRALRDFIDREGGRPIELRVTPGSPAESWCQRHGFEHADADDTRVRLVRAA